MNRFVRRPSPALVIACIALFSSLGGVSYGLARGVIDSREIKNRTIRGEDIKDKSLRGSKAKVDSFGGGAIKETSLAPVNIARGIETAVVVNPAGAIVRGTGFSSSTRTAAGRYVVTFARDVQRCAYVATVGDEGAGGPGSGTASVSANPINPNSVSVRTANAANNQPENHSFHLIVSCF